MLPYKARGDIALANVVGSNIFNLGFILALCAIITPLSIKKATVYRDTSMLILGSIFVSFFALYDHQVTRIEGGFLFVLLIAYLIYLWKRSQEGEELDLEEIPDEDLSKAQTYIRLILGLGGLIIGCQLAVESARFSQLIWECQSG